MKDGITLNAAVREIMLSSQTQITQALLHLVPLIKRSTVKGESDDGQGRRTNIIKTT